MKYVKQFVNIFLIIFSVIVFPIMMIDMEKSERKYETEGIKALGEVIEIKTVLTTQTYIVKYTIQDDVTFIINGVPTKTVIAEGILNRKFVDKGDVFEGEVLKDNPYKFHVAPSKFIIILLWVMMVFFFIGGLFGLYAIGMELWISKEIKLEGVITYAEVIGCTYSEIDKTNYAQIMYRTYDGVVREDEIDVGKKIPLVGTKYKVAYLPRKPHIVKVINF